MRVCVGGEGRGGGRGGTALDKEGDGGDNQHAADVTTSCSTSWDGDSPITLPPPTWVLVYNVMSRTILHPILVYGAASITVVASEYLLIVY